MENGPLPKSGKSPHPERAAANLSALIESTEDLIWSIDLNFGIVTFNSALQRHVERTFGTVVAVGKRPEDLLPPERAALWPPLFRRALSEGPFRIEVPFADGRTVEMSFNPIILDGEATGLSMFGKDVTERHQATVALTDSEDRFRRFFEDSISVMLLIEPLTGEIVAANRAALRFYGYQPRSLVGMFISQINTLPATEIAWERQRSLRDESTFFNFRHRLGSGEVRNVEVYSSAIDASGKPLLFSIVHDVSERIRAEEGLRETVDSLRESQVIGGLGSYLLDVFTGVWTSSEVLDVLFGIDKAYKRDVDGWTKLIHPDDRAMMAEYLAGEVVGRGRPFDKEYRIIRQRDQAERWVHGLGRLEFDVYQKPLKMRGVIKDITDHKMGEMQLRESEERYRATFEQVAVGILHTSLDGRIIRSNERFAEIIGYTLAEVRNLTFQQITPPQDIGESLAVLNRMLDGAVGTATWEKRYVRKGGSLTWVKLTVSMQHDGDGHALNFITVVEDINLRKAAEQRLDHTQVALRLSEERYRTAFQTSMDAININRVSDGVYIEVNKAFLEILGYAREEVIGRSSLDLNIWVDRRDRQTMVDTMRHDGSFRDLEAQFRTKNGKAFWGLMSASKIEIEGIPCVLSITRNITDAKASEQRLAATADALRVSEERYRTVFQTSLDPILINRADNEQFIDVNQAFLDLMGFERNEVIGRTSLDLNLWVDPNDLKGINDILGKGLECRNLEIQFRRKNGDSVWGLMSASVIEIDGIQCVIAIARDISNAKAAESEIRNLAFYDPLTGLPNRRLLQERLHQALAVSNRSGHMRALLFVDLDNFKTLNDTLGHQTGDLLLQEAALRLKTCVRETDTLGRLGGDEFVLMLEDLSGTAEDAAAEAKAVGEKILATVCQPYLLDGRECRSSASIGISIFGNRRETTDEVLQQAEIAMYQAKAAARNTLRFFAPALQAAVNARAALEEDLRQAIKTVQFVLYYQPQIDHNRLVGAEALVRWNHPRRKILPPGEFIPLAEETGLILPLGKWVLESACEQIAAWDVRGQTARLSIAVNISARQFHQPDFVQQVLAALDRTGANPRNLSLELTESMLIENIEDVIEKMKELKSHGLRFSLDDFGTGYSSLAYLKRLPLNQLKIDRSFIRDILTDESSAAIAQTIISLSRAMGLPVIAEGVETQEQRKFLTRIGCHAFQGFLFSRPLPLEEFERQWLHSPKSSFPIAS